MKRHTLLRTLPRSFRDFPAPQMERRARRARADACAPFGFGFRRICPPKRFHVSSAHLPFGGHAGRVTLPLFRGSGLCFGGALGDRALPKLQPGSGSLFAALLAPRKGVPADVKDQPPRL